MKENYYDDNDQYDDMDTGTSLIPSSGELTVESFLPDSRNANNRSSKQLARCYDSAEQAERYRASLSACAMGNTAKLATVEAQISEAVPGASRACKDIVQGYAISAIARIMRF